ncbi:intraflagellar transport protein 46 homolog isoform X1 [Clytia hemisphaerica]|uniref:Intraflagellar transport protein 46 homolog n=2 Tax=Clytia hemisphaerica TaxID=252671 RepID=A0A7M5U3F9_9CNID
MADASSDKTRLIVNQPYDESVSIYDDEEVASDLIPTPRGNRDSNNMSKGNTDQMKQPLVSDDDEDEFEHDDDYEANNKKPASGGAKPPAGGMGPLSGGSRPPPGGHVIQASDDDDEEDDDEEEDEDESSDDDGKGGKNHEGTYDPAEYEHLPVSQEIRELFQYITRYTPQSIDLDYKMKPFIPDYIPAVGDIDAFLKVMRPDGKAETLGLQILDEPAAKQSDPTVLDLQLRAIAKQPSTKQMIVRSIEEPEKKPKEIDSWISSIADLHRQKPPQSVHYTKTMPDIESLMQEWPPEFEEILKRTNLPSAELDCDLSEYVDVICSILDIPVYKDRIQSLHVLFTLYSEFKNSQHFNQLAQDNLLSNELKNQPDKSMGGAETLSFD